MLKLIGILVIILGFSFRINTLLTVVVGGIVTGLVAGLSFNEIMHLFGQTFVEDRYILLPIILVLQVIGMLEHHGLKEVAENLIKKVKGGTTGRVMLVYLFIRELSIALGLDIGGPAQTVRPILAPMAEGAAEARYGKLTEKLKNSIKSHAAAVDNVGRFFGEDIFVATGAILIMKSYFASVGIHLGVWQMALWGIPTAITAFLVMWWRLVLLDRRIKREMTNPLTGGKVKKTMTNKEETL